MTHKIGKFARRSVALLLALVLCLLLLPLGALGLEVDNKWKFMDMKIRGTQQKLSESNYHNRTAAQY
ncbi:MAG: hypothetical protein LBJ84_00745, partial [Oscillospiraceae bacterium]|nr:hypothetical protein [Oscillospiraceae bacterium]